MSSSTTPSSRELLILYATETGTAQDVADLVARECRRVHFNSKVVSMKEYDHTDIVSEPLVIFVVSTTGAGTEPRMMTPLWTMLLRSELPTDLFEDTKFAVFGLGDTSYEKFCWPAKKLSRRLESLGAKEICVRGEGDEQHPLGIDGALDVWVLGLVGALLINYPLRAGQIIIPPGELYPPRIKLKKTAGIRPEEIDDYLENEKGYYQATVQCNRRLTAQDWFQDVRHIELKVVDDIRYDPGDIAVVHPEALTNDVECFLDLVGWSEIADEIYSLQPVAKDQSIPSRLPKVSTLRSLLKYNVDFNAVPRRSFFQLLRKFVTSSLEREKLEEFLSPEGADDLYEYCYKVRRTIKEVLSEFSSARIPKDYLFDILPPMRPRLFSIASSVQRHPREVHLCVAIVKYRTKLRHPRTGVCTRFLAELTVGDRIQVGLEKGQFKLPENENVPVICVGPGTGVAPMRAVIEDRIVRGLRNNYLYFGCRSASKDQHYSSEWMGYSGKKELHYRTAFSRDGADGEKRKYVQDLLVEDSEDISTLLLEKGAFVYISGSANKMPVAVKSELRNSIETHGKLNSEMAKRFISQMESEGRLIEECWS